MTKRGGQLASMGAIFIRQFLYLFIYLLMTKGGGHLARIEAIFIR